MSPPPQRDPNIIKLKEDSMQLGIRWPRNFGFHYRDLWEHNKVVQHFEDHKKETAIINFIIIEIKAAGKSKGKTYGCSQRVQRFRQR